MERTYKITGMTCGGCVSSVQKALEQALVGTKVTVSLDEHAAVIAGAHDEAAAKEAIEDAGFDLAD